MLRDDTLTLKPLFRAAASRLGVGEPAVKAHRELFKDLSVAALEELKGTGAPEDGAASAEDEEEDEEEDDDDEAATMTTTKMAASASASGARQLRTPGRSS